MYDGAGSAGVASAKPLTRLATCVTNPYGSVCNIFEVGNTGRARGNISHDIFLSTVFRCNRRWHIAKAERGKEKVSATAAAVAAAAAVADAVVVAQERTAAAVSAAADSELS